MFETFTPAPPDAILGLTEAFKKDPNPKKVNLGVGIYKDAKGSTPVLDSVKRAEERILQNENTKNYLGIDGTAEYSAAVQELLFEANHEVITSNRSVTAQAPGGTGALRIAADFIFCMFPKARVWLSDPTWPNHPSIFKAAGLETGVYPYFDAATNGIKFDEMVATLQGIPAGDVILLHGCCHNPTGADLSPAQWQKIAAIVTARKLLPLVDFAYQGFGDGLEADAVGMRTICQPGQEVLIASSFSKNFGLYNERIGALTLVATTPAAAETALGHIKLAIRANYSSPPAHGAAIVTTILRDPTLRAQWETEVTDMRNRINQMRHLFVETLNEKGVQQDFSFIAHQRGMFSFSGLTPAHVKALREKHGVYIVGSGRISVAGMTEGNMDYLCAAIADVLK